MRWSQLANVRHRPPDPTMLGKVGAVQETPAAVPPADPVDPTTAASPISPMPIPGAGTEGADYTERLRRQNLQLRERRLRDEQSL